MLKKPLIRLPFAFAIVLPVAYAQAAVELVARKQPIPKDFKTYSLRNHLEMADLPRT
jgi:hypothetical protein